MVDVSRRSVLAAGVAAAAATPFSKAFAQAVYPDRPITVIIPWPAGGSSDTVGRILINHLSNNLGQRLVVDNKAGASGTIGHTQVARSRPDGYTLLIATNSTYAMAPYLYDNLAYDNATAFQPITLVVKMAQSLCVHPSVPVNNVREFIAYVKERPDQIPFSSAGMGASSHLATELLASAAGLKMMHVPYRGGAPSAQAVLQGETKMSFIDVITALPFVRDGQLKMLGVSTPERSELAPNVPTLSEAGLPGFSSSTDVAFLAPAGTPDEIIRFLNRATVNALKTKEVREALLTQGATPVGNTPEEFKAYFETENAKWRDVIKSRNIKAT